MRLEPEGSQSSEKQVRQYTPFFQCRVPEVGGEHDHELLRHDTANPHKRVRMTPRSKVSHEVRTACTGTSRHIQKRAFERVRACSSAGCAANSLLAVGHSNADNRLMLNRHDR